MKLVTVGFASAIFVLSGLSATFAQERYRGADDGPEYEFHRGQRDRAVNDNQMRNGDDRRRGRDDSNDSRAENGETFHYSEAQTQSGAGQSARFRFARGDARFDIRCPATAQMRECLEAASQFIREMSRSVDTEKAAAPESDTTKRQ